MTSKETPSDQEKPSGNNFSKLSDDRLIWIIEQAEVGSFMSREAVKELLTRNMVLRQKLMALIQKK